MNCVAIITARGGSKRIPGKNIKIFHGRPIIAYSIEAALSSGIFDEVMVSTDDDQIAETAESYGAIVPFRRSPKTSDDHSTTAEVLTEVILDYKKRQKNFEYACCIYPTAPFVTADKLARAFERLKATDADCILPITKFSFPIWRSFKKDNDNVFYNWPEFSLRRSQDLPAAYHDCGQFYFFKTEKFLQSNRLITDNTIGFEVPESEVQDIDNEEDWKIAELKYDLLKKKNSKWV
jgi:N-acylneuraminate cytidylyltransferase